MTELEIGGVTCGIDYRRTDEDRGPSVRVFGDVDGERVQLLRFDCFDNDPHYHYDPNGTNRMFQLDPLTMGCPVEFTLDQLARNARAMIEKAGFVGAAERVDQAELAGRIGELRDMMNAEAGS